MLRIITLTAVGIEAALWLWLLTIAFLTSSEAQENGIAISIALVASLPILVFTLPALVLALKRKLLGLALTLSLFSLASIVLVV